VTDLPSTSTIIDGRYRMLSRVGSGGMADVVCAEDLQLGRKVAIKLLHRRFAEDAEFVERFRREASSAAGLQHPHVVAVYDRGEWDGTYYIAMEYLDGRSLKRLVTDEGPLEPRRAIDLTIQILKAARFAHKRGIIHRDLKPHNVIVDGEDRAKVTDFGIARAGASDMTQTGSIMGTAQYLSPEQAQGHAVSAPSDLYSIGIILYEMITGRVPFEGESAVTIALKQVSEAPTPPTAFNPAVSPALEAVVLRALEKDPHRRFADADEFIGALEAAAQGIAPAPPPAVPMPPTDATRLLQPTGPMVPIPPVGAYQEVQQVEYGPPTLPPEGPEDEGGAGRWWVALLVGLLVAGLLVGGLLYFNQAKVKVPNVVGVDESDAVFTLRHAGLSSETVNRNSPDKPKGQVIGQDPAGGSRVKKGEVVTLTISAGPGTAQIPDLTGQPRSAALKKLEDLGFNATEERQTSDTIKENHVIETRPPANEERDKGSTVTVVISSGRQRVAVPDVKNQNVDDARSTLEQLGFQVERKDQEDSEHDPGTVLGQSVAAGKMVPKGTKITLTVAKEPAPVDVPNVVGQGQNAATNALKKAGFKVTVVPKDTQNLDEDKHVVAQDPSSGQAKKGSTVTITVGHFNPDLNPEPGNDNGGTGSGSTATPGDNGGTG
jgi:serine/threonine-protein kinase